MEYPLNEENLSPVPNLVHKYPDRALFLVASEVRHVLSVLHQKAEGWDFPYEYHPEHNQGWS